MLIPDHIEDVSRCPIAARKEKKIDLEDRACLSRHLLRVPCRGRSLADGTDHCRGKMPHVRTSSSPISKGYVMTSNLRLLREATFFRASMVLLGDSGTAPIFNALIKDLRTIASFETHPRPPIPATGLTMRPRLLSS